MSSFQLEVPVVGGRLEGQVLCMKNVTTNTTLKEVQSWILQQVIAQSSTTGDSDSDTVRLVRLYLEGAYNDFVNDDSKIGDILGQRRSIPCYIAEFRKNGSVSVSLKSLTGKALEVRCELTDTIDTFKMRVQLMDGIPPNQQRILFNDKQLEANKTLAECGVKHGSSLLLMQELREGGISGFLSNAEKNFSIEETNWATKRGPKWTTVKPGLYFRGYCRNSDCEAYREWVVVNFGCNDFDLLINEEDCLCPMCKSEVEPRRPKFNNCYYRIGSKGSDLLQVPWTKAGNVRTECKMESGVELSDMLIFVKPLDAGTQNEKSKNCAVCFQVLDERANRKLANCSHVLHEQCAVKWADAQKAKGKPTTCPLCQARY